eukprot:TRINITY_DN837_c2_g2_i1.p2 TRINITY_DN837_c2_g2~~TRINITY_DN837_c2_g2_i1.p2  ORF type:complete len:141 (-),score=40.59 TRINITY_DN837_c2_g2_i1:232-654(-)
MVWIIDQSQFTMSSSPPMKTTKATLKVLSDYFPERLGKAYMVDSPRMFSAVWSIVNPLLNEKTRNKISFVSGDLDAKREAFSDNFVDMSQLETQFGGDCTHEFDFETDWVQYIEEDEKWRHENGWPIIEIKQEEEEEVKK